MKLVMNISVHRVESARWSVVTTNQSDFLTLKKKSQSYLEMRTITNLGSKQWTNQRSTHHQTRCTRMLITLLNGPKLIKKCEFRMHWFCPMALLCVTVRRSSNHTIFINTVGRIIWQNPLFSKTSSVVTSKLPIKRTNQFGVP